MTALEFFQPLGPPPRLRAWLEARTPEQAWQETTEGGLMLAASVRVGLDRQTAAELLADAADSEALRRFIDTGDKEQLRADARAYLTRAANADASERRGLYAKYAALMALLRREGHHDPFREPSSYAHAAQAYAGVHVAASKVRSAVPFADFDALARANPVPEPPEDETPSKGKRPAV